jgi:hypothetical protein
VKILRLIFPALISTLKLAWRPIDAVQDLELCRFIAEAMRQRFREQHRRCQERS